MALSTAQRNFWLKYFLKMFADAPDLNQLTQSDAKSYAEHLLYFSHFTAPDAYKNSKHKETALQLVPLLIAAAKAIYMTIINRTTYNLNDAFDVFSCGSGANGHEYIMDHCPFRASAEELAQAAADMCKELEIYWLNDGTEQMDQFLDTVFGHALQRAGCIK